MAHTDGFGARAPRKEDARLLSGRGRYVSDLQLPRLVHVAFVRSPLAHAQVRSVATEAALALPGVLAVATGADPDIAGVWLEAESALASYVTTRQPVLAWPKVRFAGEAVAAVVATDRYVAEDAAELVEVDYQERPVVVDAVRAMAGAGAALHAEAPDNILLTRRFQGGDVTLALGESALVLERGFRTNRHAGAPLEGRASVADWDPSSGSLTLWSGTQIPHVVRNGLSQILGVAEHKIRVIAPDVGGGFGVKAVLYPEDVAVCLLSRRLGRPVKWVEDRVEGLAAAAHARDHHYNVTAGFDEGGVLQGLWVRVVCNVGAYSVYPWTAGLEPLMAGGLFTGPYKCENFDCEVFGVATNTAPAGPYRGVARPATTFVMERMLEIGARALGLDPVDVRRVNLITAEDLPYTAATRLVHDESCHYVEPFERVVERIGYEAFRARQASAASNGRRLGIGFACYNELTGLGRAASAGPRMPFRTGHEAVTVRLDPSGTATVLTGVTSQGQGLETTMAQIVASELGLRLADVDVALGDTATALFGFGAFSSRQGVIGGGAALLAAGAVRSKVLLLAAHLLEADPGDLELLDAAVVARDAPSRRIALAEVCRVAYLEAHRLPPDFEPGLEATKFYDPVLGTFAGGAQAAIVEVDVATGAVRIDRYVCVEDSGRMINPMIVEGQVEGSLAQGIGGALYEHLLYDDLGNLTTGTLMDYLLPTSLDIPAFELGHIVEPANNAVGVRGVGEGGTLGSAAVIANAVSDALGIEINDLPVSPSRVWEALAHDPR